MSAKIGDTVVLVEADGSLRGRGRVVGADRYQIKVQFDANRPASWIDRDQSRFDLSLEVEVSR